MATIIAVKNDPVAKEHKPTAAGDTFDPTLIPVSTTAKNATTVDATGVYTPQSARAYSGTVVTGSNGQATLTIPAGVFTATPVATATIMGAVDDVSMVTVLNTTTTSVTVRCRESATATLLGLTLLSAPSNKSNATIAITVVQNA